MAEDWWSKWQAEVECDVCGESLVVVAFYMMYGGRLAYCKGCWTEVWQVKGEGRERMGVPGSDVLLEVLSANG